MYVCTQERTVSEEEPHDDEQNRSDLLFEGKRGAADFPQNVGPVLRGKNLIHRQKGRRHPLKVHIEAGRNIGTKELNGKQCCEKVGEHQEDCHVDETVKIAKDLEL